MQTKKSKAKLFDDEMFGVSINLQTGQGINLQRKLANDDEIQQLTISQKLSRFQRAKKIILQGQKIQKWSVLQNFSFYVNDLKNFKPLIQLFSSQTKQLNKQLLVIMGYGISCFLQQPLYTLPEPQQSILWQLIHKMFIYQQSILTDQWIQTFRHFIHSYPNYITEVEEYITGSFDLKASPQRRRIALLMLEISFDVMLRYNFRQHSQKLRKQTIRKILDFSEDYNKISRKSICILIRKYLQLSEVNQQIWKIVWEYALDKELIVREESFKILSLHKRSDNLPNILSLLDSHQNAPIIFKYFDDLINTYVQVLQNSNIHLQLLNIVNRMLLSKSEQLINIILKNVYKLIQIYGEKFLQEIYVQIKQINYENKQNAISYCNFYASLKVEFRKEEYRNIFYSILKLHTYDISECIERIIECFNYQTEIDFDYYIKICGKMLQNSKWNGIEKLLKNIEKWRFTKTIIEKITVFLIKLLMISPNCLLDVIFESYRIIILNSKKKLDFIYNVKEKLLSSKNHVHRKYYLMFYAYLYKKLSWQSQKLLPSITFSMILVEKILSVKLMYAKSISDIYQYIDPNQVQTKSNLKQLLKRYAQQKDACLNQIVTQSQKKLVQIDSNQLYQEQSIARNKILMEQESKYFQTQDQFQKQIRSQKFIKQQTKKTQKTESKKTLIMLPSQKQSSSTKLLAPPPKIISKSQSSTAKIPLQIDLPYFPKKK